jgi:hypothetical protein
MNILIAVFSQDLVASYIYIYSSPHHALYACLQIEIGSWPTRSPGQRLPECDCIKGMYNSIEGMHSLSPPRHLEKAQDITCTMYYLLLSS